MSKIGWWHSFEERDGLAVWGKEIANLVPEIYVCGRDREEILLMQQGTYVVKVLVPHGGEVSECLVVGDEEV